MSTRQKISRMAERKGGNGTNPKFGGIYIPKSVVAAVFQRTNEDLIAAYRIKHQEGTIFLWNFTERPAEDANGNIYTGSQVTDSGVIYVGRKLLDLIDPQETRFVIEALPVAGPSCIRITAVVQKRRHNNE